MNSQGRVIEQFSFALLFVLPGSPVAGDAAPSGVSSSAYLIAVVILQALVIGYLLFQRARRERVALELKDNEEHLRALFERNKDGLVITDDNGRFVRTNLAAAEILGYSHEEMLARTVFDLESADPPDIVTRYNAYLEAGFRTGEWSFIRPDGEFRTIRYTTTRYGPGRHLSIVRDVTETKRAEEALRQSESRYRQMFEQNRAVKLLLDPFSGEIVDANTAASEFYGYELEELRRMTIMEITLQSREEIAHRLQQTANGLGYFFESRHRLASGEVRDVEVQSSPLHLADRTLLYSIINDITERRQAEIALRESEHRFRQLAENIDAVFFMSEGVDRVEPQRVIYVSPAYERIWGRSRERLYRQQRSWFEGVHPEDRNRIAASFPKIAIGEFDEEFRVLRPDGEIRWVHDRVFPIYDDLGQVYRIAGIVEDITDRKLSETRLNQLNAELEGRVISRTADLESKTREMESFAYSVAHDLKAPLRGIDGYSRLLLARHSATLEEEGRKLLVKVRSAIQQMNQLIDDLLDYSRIERRQLRTTRINLHTLVHSVVDEMTHDLQRPDLRLEFDVDCNMVFADTEALTQALRNLLDNAVKFTRNVAETRIEIGARDTGDGSRIWVKDNGIGLDPKFHERIFELFQRLHGAEEYAGTGVGLALVRKAVSRMGGRVWVESAPGRGATFFLELPHQFDLVTAAPV